MVTEGGLDVVLFSGVVVLHVGFSKSGKKEGVCVVLFRRRGGKQDKCSHRVGARCVFPFDFYTPLRIVVLYLGRHS